MKRPVTLLAIASLLVSASALAANGASRKFDDRVAAKIEHTVKHDNNRGHDNRGNDHRGNDNRGNGNPGRDNRGNDHRGGDARGPASRGNDYRGGDARSPANRGNDHRGSDNNRHDFNGNRNDRPNSNNRHDWNDSRNDHRNDNRGWDRNRSDWANHPNYWDNRRHDRRDYARYRYNYGQYRAPRGYHYRVWHRGDYLPRSYYGSSYIVYDWRPYRLYSPPYGYHWVRVGNDVLLTALATGVVLDVLYDIWY